MKSRAVARSVDAYVAAFTGETRTKLEILRAAVKTAASGADERTCYGMPDFFLEGVLVYFAAFKDHIGFFPTSSGIRAFRRELADYETSKGTVRFPLDRPLPLRLIAKVVKFRVAENLKKAAVRPGKRK